MATEGLCAGSRVELKKGLPPVQPRGPAPMGNGYGNSSFGVQGYVALKSHRFWRLGGILMVQGFFILGGF